MVNIKCFLLIISIIIIYFVSFTVDNAVFDRVCGIPSDEEERGFQNVHITLEALLKVIPL